MSRRLSKHTSISDDGPDNINSSGVFTVAIFETLELVVECQNEINELSDKANEEILEIEQKYNELRMPGYEKRGELIKKIPKFWLTAFMNHPRLSTLLDDAEKECLHFWTELEVEEDTQSSCRIRFHFEENPYFENKVLTKEFQLGTMGGKYTQSYGPSSTSSSIQWKECENLLKDSLSNKERRNSNYTGFFNWFTDDSDEPVIEIAGTLKNDLWANPLLYYRVPVPADELKNNANNDVNQRLALEGSKNQCGKVDELCAFQTGT